MLGDSDVPFRLLRWPSRAAQLVRRSEQDFKDNNLGRADITEDELIAAMVKHPKLIERPIVVSGNRAVLGRPPENVLELL